MDDSRTEYVENVLLETKVAEKEMIENKVVCKCCPFCVSEHRTKRPLYLQFFSLLCFLISTASLLESIKMKFLVSISKRTFVIFLLF